MLFDPPASGMRNPTAREPPPPGESLLRRDRACHAELEGLGSAVSCVAFLPVRGLGREEGERKKGKEKKEEDGGKGALKESHRE